MKQNCEAVLLWRVNMPLPKEKSEIKEDLGRKIILLYSQPKFGKTSLAAQFPETFFFATEPGCNNVSVFKDDITSWKQFLDDCKELAVEASDAFKKGKLPRFRTLVIDTVDMLYKFCSDAKCKEKGITHESELPFGKGFAMVNNEFLRVLDSLAKLPYGLIMISHTKEKEYDSRLGKYKKIVPSLPEGAKNIVIALADIIFYGDIEDTKDETGKQLISKRVLRTKPTKFYEAGDRTGRLSDSIELGYESLLKDYNKGRPLDAVLSSTM